MRHVPLALAAAALMLAACDAPPSASAPERDAPRARTAAAALAGAPAGGAEPVVYRFRSVEDPAFPPEAEVCAAMPFAANLRLGASLWAESVRASDGRVMNGGVRRVGTATACGRITDPTFPAGLMQAFAATFHLAEGDVTAVGGCTLVSNDVPRPGLVLAGCHLRVTDAPAGYAGGSVTSLSVFNPAGLPGFATGSEWTVQLYPAG